MTYDSAGLRPSREQSRVADAAAAGLPWTSGGSLLDDMPTGLLLLGADDRIIRVNRALAEWSGRPMADLLGRRFDELLTPPSRSYYHEHHAARSRSQGLQEVSYDITGPDSESIPVLVTSRPLLGDDGEERHICVLYRAGIRRRYESRLLEAKRAADAATRARTTFLGTVTHEVRTPIHAVLGTAELLRATPLDEEQSRLVDLLADSGETLLALVNDVLELSHASESELQVKERPTDLTGLVNATLASLRPTVNNPDVRLESITGLRCPEWVLVDAVKLRQALTNLLSNAIRHTSSGYVRVQVDCVPEVDALCDGPNAVQFVVEDTGTGIPAEDRETIFLPFRQSSLTARPGGSGLGLAITKRIVEALGGRIELDSELGRGSRFAFTLTLFPASAPQKAAPFSADGSVDALNGRSVLVVDDNDTNRFIARRHLRSFGIESVEAASGAEALALSTERPFDAVLLDLRMPGMDGYETAMRLRRLPLHVRTPIISVTAASLPPDDDAPTRGDAFDDRLLKPFNAAQLADKLLAHLAGKPPRTRKSAAGAVAQVPQPVPLRDARPRATINLEEYEREFANPGDTADFAQLLGLMGADLREAAPELEAAARRGDRATLRSVKHRLHTVLHATRPEPLTRLLREAVHGEATADELRDIGGAARAAASLLERRRAQVLEAI